VDPPSEVYGKVMAIDDKLMPHYYEWATELPMQEVRATLDALASKALHPREAKRKLARTITAELHSAAAADEAEREFDRVHKQGAPPDAAPTVDVKVNGQKEVPIVDLVVSAFAKSKSDAKRLVAQNGVRVDGAVASEETKVPVKGEPLLQIGKRQAVRIRFR
jgi:tyrosyl-tRNA synthetase